MLPNVVNVLFAIVSITRCPFAASLRNPATVSPPSGNASLTAVSSRNGVSGPIWSMISMGLWCLEEVDRLDIVTFRARRHID
jgi:hypothetical protein